MLDRSYTRLSRVGRNLLCIASLLSYSCSGLSHGRPPATPKKMDYGALLNDAASNIDEDYRDRWAYTETSRTSNGVFVSRYDPSNAPGKRWTLLTVDGREPKAKETKKFLKEKAEEEERSQQDGSGPKAFTEGVEKLTLLKETDDVWVLGFVPKGEGDNAKVMKKLNGSFTITKDSRVLQSITLKNEKSFKPNFTTRIYTFFMHYDFAPVGTDGPYLPNSLDFQIALKAVGVVKVDETVNTTFSDYQLVVQ